MLLSCYTVLRLPAELLVVATMIVTFAIVVVVDVAAGMANVSGVLHLLA